MLPPGAATLATALDDTVRLDALRPTMAYTEAKRPAISAFERAYFWEFHEGSSGTMCAVT